MASQIWPGLVSVDPGWAVLGTAHLVHCAWVIAPGCYHAWVIGSSLGSPKSMGERANRGERGMREEEKKEREKEKESGEEMEERERKRNFGGGVFKFWV